ncbi:MULTISPECIES: Sec-dependent nitrous-oxide reductase [Anoxybacillus]|uniref:Nitrous-oxide reductase n=1 Tax=Anoxybacillus flavithermus TaxID=33934 RepID=A0A178TKG0_9BACL|nr:Sec-dependent nitrous-oxide reductase [Anoxybacillus flavithermus]ASA96105.1 nitrous-oxide reductase [Anoxybacillus flavithermus]ELK21738.1 nitrous-oxide reductase, Sec-dependent [Anoxybacillus flavithermus TNO-09.006]MBE2905111.1 Sec-dependent nitrous-oxide reductase [Anoxybacillus flavithermus]MBE2915669.1 Sec-dependent nitrous-oxide reductase [Anoxybacillus flavithermus]MBE2918628.1 Sec-dependent nitrous-oxide reductase [Anoxybacillus flavithermus]
MKKKWISAISGLAVGVLASTVFFGDFSPKQPTSTASAKTNAEKVYVPFGEKDEYYLFASGGHSGQLFVYGVPSLRRIRTVPVFSLDSATGYGWDEHSKKMLGGYTWGDLHHPALSETNGDYDGKYLFATDVANSRAAVMDLKTFTVKDIISVPNTSGPHCAAFVTENTEYLFLPTRFAVPLGDKYESLDDYSTKYRGVMSAVTFDENEQKLNIAYQVALPPWSYDLSDAGKKVSKDWAVITTYNTEEATTNLEINASKEDRDFIVLFNWRELEKMVKEGKYDTVEGQKVIFPEKHEGGIYLIPVAKSPHGVDVTPDGKRFIASGKLAPLLTVFSFEKAFKAIENKEFAGERNGIPILKYESVMEREVNPENALGPLHTQFDDKGMAYTTMFISSEVVKWDPNTGEVLDRVPVQYSPGHSVAAEGDTVSPDGKYLVSLNKLAKDSYLSVGPSHPESMQLIDISGKMEVIQSAPVDPEPHYGQMIKADKIKTIEVYPKDEKNPYAVFNQKDTRIVRKGNEVHVYGIAMRSKFIFDAKAKRPDVIEVNEGDKVFIHLTNIDRDEDITHGFAINKYNINIEVQPGQTNTVEFVADKAGTYPIYCTNFCSALHQEMTGYLLVKPKQ